MQEIFSIFFEKSEIFYGEHGVLFRKGETHQSKIGGIQLGGKAVEPCRNAGLLYGEENAVRQRECLRCLAEKHYGRSCGKVICGERSGNSAVVEGGAIAVKDGGKPRHVFPAEEAGFDSGCVTSG